MALGLTGCADTWFGTSEDPPLPGTRISVLALDAQLEAEVAAHEPELCAGLEREGLRQERRPLRLPVQDLQGAWTDDDTLELAFTLARGGYATSVLREIAVYRDASG